MSIIFMETCLFAQIQQESVLFIIAPIFKCGFINLVFLWNVIIARVIPGLWMSPESLKELKFTFETNIKSLGEMAWYLSWSYSSRHSFQVRSKVCFLERWLGKKLKTFWRPRELEKLTQICRYCKQSLMATVWLGFPEPMSSLKLSLGISFNVPAK